MDESLYDLAACMMREPTVQTTLDLDVLIEKVRTPEDLEAEEEILRTSEYTGPALRNRYLPPAYDLDGLARLPAGTLGYAYARHMLDNGLRADFFEDLPPTNDRLYVRLRLFQTHDIMHAVTGYGTSTEDETGITGFYFGQQDRYLRPGGGTVMRHTGIQTAAVLLHHALTDPEAMRQHFASFVDGAARGYAAKPFLATRFEERWDVPLERIREDLAVAPARPTPA